MANQFFELVEDYHSAVAKLRIQKWKKRLIRRDLLTLQHARRRKRFPHLAGNENGWTRRCTQVEVAAVVIADCDRVPVGFQIRDETGSEELTLADA